VFAIAGVWKARRYAVAVTVSASSSGNQSMTSQRKGSGTTIVWFRNDLRISDNEALLKAWQSSQTVVPLYCVDPRLYGSTNVFGFAKTGGERWLGV
jgi:deoxyribodipyrimidine photo-lyase